MKERAEEDVLAFLREAIKPEYGDADYEACKTDDGWTLEVKQMYDYVPFGAEQLFKLCEFFDTMNINDSRYHSSGCETCDYGSSYEVTIYVKDGKPFPKAAA